MIKKAVVYYPRALHGDGGVTNALWLWAESLQRAGLKVIVLHDASLALSSTRRVPTGIETHGVLHLGRGRRTVPRTLSRHLDDSTLLILHSAYVPFNVLAGELARRHSAPYLVVPHGAFDPNVRARHHTAR